MKRKEAATKIKDLRDAWPDVAAGTVACKYCVGGALGRGLMDFWASWWAYITDNYATPDNRYTFPDVLSLSAILQQYNPELPADKADYYARDIITCNDSGRVPAAWFTAECALGYSPEPPNPYTAPHVLVDQHESA